MISSTKASTNILESNLTSTSSILQSKHRHTLSKLLQAFVQSFQHILQTLSAILFVEQEEKEEPPKPAPPTKPRFQRIEDWDEELMAQRKNGTLSWEDRVQMDGLRYGNQFRQNEILYKSLQRM